MRFEFLYKKNRRREMIFEQLFFNNFFENFFSHTHMVLLLSLFIALIFVSLSKVLCTPSKHSFGFIFVLKYKLLFKLLDAFIIFFLNIPSINTINLS